MLQGESRGRAGFWTPLRDQTTTVPEGCGAGQKGSRQRGLTGFGLAAGKKKLPLAELDQICGGAVGAEIRASLWTCSVSYDC